MRAHPRKPFAKGNKNTKARFPLTSRQTDRRWALVCVCACACVSVHNYSLKFDTRILRIPLYSSLNTRTSREVNCGQGRPVVFNLGRPYPLGHTSSVTWYAKECDGLRKLEEEMYAKYRDIQTNSVAFSLRANYTD
jgi:hypothetical protein